MKNLLTILLIILPLSAYAWGVVATSGGVAAAPAGCTENCAGYAICENAEGSGTPSGWTDSVGSGGTVDWDDTTSTILRGTQQLEVTSNTAETKTSYSLSAMDEGYFHVRYKTADGTPSSAIDFIFFSNTGGGGLYLTQRTDGNIRAWHGTSILTSSTTPCAGNNTQYHMWGHYAKATSGSNGVYEIWVGSSGTFSSATKIIDGTNGQSTAQINILRFKTEGASSFYFDQIYVSTSAIGDVCD